MSSPDARPGVVDSVGVIEAPLIALTPLEYNNTIRDLLGMPSEGSAWPDPPEIIASLIPASGQAVGLFGFEPAAPPPWPWMFPPEEGVHGFEGLAAGQHASVFLVEELQKSAVRYAAYALVSPIFFTCEDWADQPELERQFCGWESVKRFTQRAFRRPISSQELDRLKTWWEFNWNGGTPEEAVAFTVAGVLQSPPFLFRVENGDGGTSAQGVVALTGWEMASRLSYLLWDTMPDPGLFQAASNGDLATVEGIEDEARRMLKDARARDALVHFHAQWLETRQVHAASPARSAFGPLFGIAPDPPLDTSGDGDWPAILQPIRHSMEAEAHLFIAQTIFEGAGTLEALLSEHHGFMSSSTAPLYGDEVEILDGPTVAWDFGQTVNSLGGTSTLVLSPAVFPADERAGLLTLPAVLATGAYSVHPAPILRGKRVLERVACEHFGTPPPGVEASIPPDTDEAVGTNRERTEAATSSQACAGCHDALNPPGLAFEHYDAMGAFRDLDNGEPVDASGSVTLSGGEVFTFTDGVDLAHQLAVSNQVRDCYVTHWVRYATGVEVSAQFEGMAALRDAFHADDRVVELLVGIVTSDFFRFRKQEGTP
jgi:hypothetical protein